MMNDSKRRAAQWLGYAGLIPFFAMAALLVFGWYQHDVDHATVEMVLLSYGAIILTFVGALSWAHAMHRAELSSWWIVWSVVPSLVGWLAICVPAIEPGTSTQIAVLALIAGFLAQLIADLRMRNTCNAATKNVFPDWFVRMRVHLTLAACASLSVMFFIR
jgi:Protein of unknown function (DUF3429)